jgi:hypothetical protein
MRRGNRYNKHKKIEENKSALFSFELYITIIPVACLSYTSLLRGLG